MQKQDKLKQAQKEAWEQYQDGLISYRECVEQIERARKHAEMLKRRN